MATAVFGSPILVIEGEQASLTTTASYLLVKPTFHEVKMYCASQWRMALAPSLLHCLYYSASAGTYTEYRTQAIDRVSTTHVPLDAMATGDYLYLGTSEQVLGYYFNLDVTNLNANAASLDMEYCSIAPALGTVAGRTAIAFTDVAGTDSDGTLTVTETLSQDGVYTWGTSPGTAWVESTLGTYDVPLYSKCFWIRFKPSATLSATIDVVDLIPVYKNTNYMYMEPGIEYQFSLNTAKVGAFTLLGTTTSTLDVGWVRH